LAADVAGYSRLMGADEVGTLRNLTQRRVILDGLIASHRGRIANTAGDSVLAEFGSAVDAVQCAVEAHAALAGANAGLSPDRQINFRIGIHVGDVMVKGGDLFGDGVNIAARLEGVAEPGGVCMSDDAYRQIRGKVEVTCDDLGPQTLKNIAEPMRAWRIVPGGKSTAQAQPASPASQAPALALPDKPSIAVLPFKNMSGDPEQEYFADGIVEDIIAALNRVKSFFVIARNSSFAYKGKHVDIRQVGRELGVRYVLEGSIRRSGTRVRITGQLVEAESGLHIWADRFDGEFADVFDLQDRVTQAVAGVIEPNLRLAETNRARIKPTQNLSAYDHYLLALEQSYLWTEEGFEAAKIHIARAVTLDPHYSLAKAIGSFILMRRKMQSLASDDDVRQGIAWAREALAAHKDDPITLRAAGQTIAVLDRDFDLGLFSVRKAVEICPNSALVLSGSGWVHAYVGDKLTSVDHFTQAIRLSPLDREKGSFLSGMALAHIISKDYKAAVEYANQAALEFPSAVPIRMATVALALLGLLDEACAMGQRLLKVSPGFRVSKASIPARDKEACDRFVQGLRLAKLPE
jgi:adenylate cyclase